jgi:hypothetical protein
MAAYFPQAVALWRLNEVTEQVQRLIERGWVLLFCRLLGVSRLLEGAALERIAGDV